MIFQFVDAGADHFFFDIGVFQPQAFERHIACPGVRRVAQRNGGRCDTLEADVD
jgi:hypothetical protein